MKYRFLIPIFLLCSRLFAQELTDTSLDSVSVLDTNLESLKKERDSINAVLNDKILELETSVNESDSLFKVYVVDKNINEALSELQTRLSNLEQIGSLTKSKDSSAFSTNLIIAVDQLSKMHDIYNKVELFNSTRNFYNDVSQLANPQKFPDFLNAFEDIKKRAAKKQSSRDLLNAIDSTFFSKADTSRTISVNPVMSAIYYSSSLIMGKLSKLIEPKEYEKMIPIINYTLQFEGDSREINSKLNQILSKNSDLIQRHRKLVYSTLQLIDVDSADFFNVKRNPGESLPSLNFDANVKSKINTLIDREYKKIGWKTPFLSQFEKIKRLRLETATMLMNMHGAFEEYNQVITRYKNIKQFGGKVSHLKVSLNSLQQSLKANFRPTSYYENSFSLFDGVIY